jgi:hypothetical protein
MQRQGMLSYEILVVHREARSANWEVRWIFTDALTHFLFFLLLVCISVLWWPTERAMSYAYMPASTKAAGSGFGGDFFVNSEEQINLNLYEGFIMK